MLQSSRRRRRRRPRAADKALLWLALYTAVIPRTLALVDVVSKLYQLSRAKQAFADKISLSAIPTTLARRLSEKSLQWDSLSGLLQRALLWDTGLVLTTGGDLIQVHVPCGKPMTQIFVSKDVFNDVFCPLVACNQKNLAFASTNCSIAGVRAISQCAIEDDVGVVSQSTLWAQDGDVDSALDIRVYRYEAPPIANATTTATFAFTINQEPTSLRTRKDCPAKPFFIVPCTVRTPENGGDWCPPSRGGFVDVWIDAELAASDGGGASLSTAAMTLIVFAFALTLGVCIAWFYYKKRRQALRGQASTMMFTSGELPTISGKSDDGIAAIVPLSLRNNSFYAELTLNRAESDEDVMEVDMLNESLCRQSEDLMILRQDRELMKKRIPYADLRFIKLIARGANGEVWRAEHNGQTVAIKNLLPEKRHDRAAIELFAKEIRLASSLEHPNIVRFIGLAWRRLSDICSISEFMARGDMSDLMNSKQSGRLRWNEDKMCIAIDVASALVYLHSLVPSIIHRDLKSHNILLNESLQAKLSDFGLSRERSFEETMTNGIGTLLWTAPEILRGEAYTEKADIFSYGIVLAELDTCLPPYSLNDEVRKLQLTSMQLMHLVTKGELTPRFRADCPAALQELARRCVSISGADRPSAAEIVFTLRSHVLPSVLVAARSKGSATTA